MTTRTGDDNPQAAASWMASADLAAASPSCACPARPWCGCHLQSTHHPSQTQTPPQQRPEAWPSLNTGGGFRFDPGAPKYVPQSAPPPPFSEKTTTATTTTTTPNVAPKTAPVRDHRHSAADVVLKRCTDCWTDRPRSNFSPGQWNDPGPNIRRYPRRCLGCCTFGRCECCGKEQPADQFDVDSSDGLLRLCRICALEVGKAMLAQRGAPSDETCSQCHETLPLYHFSKSQQRRKKAHSGGGAAIFCRVCVASRRTNACSSSCDAFDTPPAAANHRQVVV